MAIDTYMHTFIPSGSIAPGNLKHYLSLVGIEPSLLTRETLVCYFGYARNIWFATFETLLSTETAIYNLTNRSNKLPKFTVFFSRVPYLFPSCLLQFCNIVSISSTALRVSFKYPSTFFIWDSGDITRCASRDKVFEISLVPIYKKQFL